MIVPAAQHGGGQERDAAGLVPEGDEAEVGDLQEHVDAGELVQPGQAWGRVLGEEVFAGEGFGE